MALNAYARALTDRVVNPIARVLVRVGFTANGLTSAGLVLTGAGAVVVLSGRPLAGAAVLAVGNVIDAFDGAVARLRGTQSRFGAFYDSVADRVSDGILLGTAAWLVRAEPLMFIVAMAALVGAQLTSYIRAKAESLGWNATVGVLERAERVIILVLAIAFGVLEVALWVLAVGALITVVQRVRVVLAQSRAGTPSSGGRTS